MNFLVMPIFFSRAPVPARRPAGGPRVVTKLDPLSYGIDGLRGRSSV